MEVLKTLVDYNYAEHRQLWNVIANLDESVFLKDTGYSMGTIQRTVVHIIRADHLWLSRALGRLDAALLPFETIDRGRIREVWDDLEHAVKGFVGSLSEEDSQCVVTYVHQDGSVQGRRVFELILHICNHGTVHRAELCAMFHMLGHTIAFDVSLRRYLEETSVD